MYRVLIVDDEEPVLESYGFILECGVSGFALAGKARSGYEAIKLMYELKPDVVFMDINMPGIDGLETIAQVHDKFPETVFVLSTAYERFDLARRAIPLGVHAYLVKPVTKKVFIDTLVDIAALFDKRKTARQSSVGSILEQQFLREFLWKENPPSRWQEYREELSLDSNRGMVCFVSLDSGNDNLFPDINAQLGLTFRFLFTMYLDLGMYFFSGDFSPDDVPETVKKVLVSLVPLSVVSLAGFGSVRDGPELFRSCTEALEDLHQKKNMTDVRIRERMRIIQLRRKNGLADSAEVLSLFTAYRDEIFSAYEFNLAKAKMVALFTILLDDCTGCYQSHTDEPPPFSPSEEITALADMPAVSAWTLAAFNRIYALAHQKRTGEVPVPLVKAIAFIDANYCNQIQLTDAANAASVSGAYLSRLFGEHMGSSFVDYLTILRIENAERLMRERRISIKEVSYEVGYQDPNYFSKIFRKIVGVSPSMYAERSKYENT